MPRVRRTHTDKHLIATDRANAALAAEVTRHALERADELLSEGKDREAGFAARTAQHASLAHGIAIDKARLVANEPTQIVRAERDVDDIMRSLSAAVPGLVIDGTAQEIPPAELPPAA